MATIPTKFIRDLAVTTAKLASASVTTAKLASDLNLPGAPTAATPSSGDSSTKLATTAFVSTAITNAIEGLDPKESVRVATTANISLSSAPASIDGVTLASGNRVLVKNQTTGADNGIYVFNGAASAMTRSSDADGSPASEVTSGMYCFVEEGTLAQTGWVLATANPITLGTTSLSFTQFNGAASIIAGTGLTKTGNTLDVGAGDGIQVDADSVTVKIDGSTLSKSASGLKVADGGIANAQVSASAAITYSKLALSNSIVAGDLTSDSVTTAKIMDANVTAAKLASDSVTTAKIVDANVTTAKLADSSVTTAKIADTNVTAAKLASDSVTTIKILDANVTTAKLADDSVTKAKIAADIAGNGLSQAVGGELDVNVDGSTLEIALDTLQVKDAGITAAKLATDSVTTLKIVDANVTAAKLATDSVTTIKIVDANVTTAKLADSSVTTAKLADDSVTSAKIANDAVGATEIAAGSISNSHVNAAAAIAYSKLALSNSIVAGDLTTDSVTTLKIQDSAVTAAKLASDSVTTIKILDSNVTTAKIADANVTAAKLASDSVTTAKILDSNVTTAKIADSAVTNAKLAGSITSDKMLDGRYELTLNATDVNTNFYKEITATQKLDPDNHHLFCDGVMQRYGVDYDFDNSGAQTKIRFDSTNLPSSDLATGGAAALIATDKLYVSGLRLA